MYSTDNKETVTAALCATYSRDDTEACDSLDELERLLETSGGKAGAKILQQRDRPDPKTYIGSGKCAEIAALVNDGSINLAVFDDELSPSQIANIEDAVGCRVIDRTMLILDIFASRAITAEGKLQVEIACLRYSAPRLTGRGKDLSRLGGGIGTRGPGESQLETDRRHLKRRIAALRERLDDLERKRNVVRERRTKGSLRSAAIVGYTNAGKSTLLNRLTDAGILAEDKLFATLDPTTRRLRLPSGTDILLTDTVGFINRLPHHLVDAFRSTLDEVRYSDVIVEICDASDPHDILQMKNSVTADLLSQLGAGAKPLVRVYNKCDIADDGAPFREAPVVPPDAVMISARTGKGIDALLERLDREFAALGKTTQEEKTDD